MISKCLKVLLLEKKVILSDFGTSFLLLIYCRSWRNKSASAKSADPKRAYVVAPTTPTSAARSATGYDRLAFPSATSATPRISHAGRSDAIPTFRCGITCCLPRLDCKCSPSSSRVPTNAKPRLCHGSILISTSQYTTPPAESIFSSRPSFFFAPSNLSSSSCESIVSASTHSVYS